MRPAQNQYSFLPTMRTGRNIGVALLALLAIGGTHTEDPASLADPNQDLAVVLPVEGLVPVETNSPGSDKEDAATSNPTTHSMGYPSAGRLAHGLHLGLSDHIRLVSHYRERDYLYGTLALVRLIENSAEQIAKTMAVPARVAVGELSAPTGGRISSHRSHQNGRDADIGFYMLDASGRPFEASEFVAFSRSLEIDFQGQRVRFDVERNWLLIEHWLTSSIADVQFIFVSRPLKAALLAEARRRGVSSEVLRRAELVIMQPPRAASHDDHFHVRIFCPEDAGEECLDRAPVWPWVLTPTREQSLPKTNPRPAIH